MPTSHTLERMSLLAVLSFGILLTVHLFEGMGYEPCALCYRQRLPWYALLAVSALGVYASKALPERSGTQVARWVSFAGALLMIASIGMGIHHAGVEWALWAGPSACTISTSFVTGVDLLGQLNSAPPVSCSEASVRFLGLSFAGWNVVASALALLASIWIFTRSRTITK